MLQRKVIPVPAEVRAERGIDGTTKEWREPGTRNYIRVGDVVKVLPTAPKKRDGFEAKVLRIHERPNGEVHFDVIGGKGGRLLQRTVRADRVARVAQNRTHSETGIVTRRERRR